MEWLDFKRWSPEVERQLAIQAARLHQAALPVVRAGQEHASATVAAAYRLSAMLRVYPRTNPWGHPVKEC